MVDPDAGSSVRIMLWGPDSVPLNRALFIFSSFASISLEPVFRNAEFRTSGRKENAV